MNKRAKKAVSSKKLNKTEKQLKNEMQFKLNESLNTVSQRAGENITQPPIPNLLGSIPLNTELYTSSEIDTLLEDKADVKDLPQVPVKSIKQNGVELTPDSNGAVNVKGTYYATCNTEQFTAAKVATLVKSNETFVLETGVVVYVKFDYASVAEATLNVANTGAKDILCGSNSNTVLATPNTQIWTPGEVVAFVYDGSVWRTLKPTLAGISPGIVNAWPYLSNVTDTSIVPTMSTFYKVGTSIAPYFVPYNSTYSAGDYVMYNDGKLYKAKEDIPTNTPWQAGKWKAVTVEGEIKEEKTNVQSILNGMPEDLGSYDKAIQAINVLWDAVHFLAYGKNRLHAPGE